MNFLPNRAKSKNPVISHEAAEWLCDRCQVTGDRWQVTGDEWFWCWIFTIKSEGNCEESLKLKISTFSFIHDSLVMKCMKCHEMSWNWPRSRARKIIIFLNIFLNNIFPDIDWQKVCRHPGNIPGCVRKVTVDSWQLTVDSWQYTVYTLGCRVFSGGHCRSLAYVPHSP